VVATVWVGLLVVNATRRWLYGMLGDGRRDVWGRGRSSRDGIWGAGTFTGLKESE
jgi:hypothetical protein